MNFCRFLLGFSMRFFVDFFVLWLFWRISKNKLVSILVIMFYLSVVNFVFYNFWNFCYFYTFFQYMKQDSSFNILAQCSNFYPLWVFSQYLVFFVFLYHFLTLLKRISVSIVQHNIVKFIRISYSNYRIFSFLNTIFRGFCI